MDVKAFDGYNITTSEETFMTITSGATDDHHVPSVCYPISPVESIGHDIRSTQFSKNGCCDTLTANDYKDPVIVAYSIGSMNSKGMLSKNPTAGYHETDVARTIDANGSNPAGYQGGDVVLAFKERAGKPGGGKGILIGEDKGFTLAKQTIDAVCYQNSTGAKE